MKVTAILACHNRRASTLECLDSYFAQVVDDALELDAVLVDDGSTDGTGEAVRDRFPQTHVVAGSGDLFWAGGMEVAERVAVAEDPDYLLWLNDDVILDPGALTKLIQTESLGPGACIAVGALRDPATGELTYSGLRRRGLHPLRMDRVAPADEPVEIDTFNGNVVLVSHSARRKIGPIDGAMGHAAADFDYGFRAKHAGVQPFLAPGTVGTCARNKGERPWVDQSLPLRQRLRLLLGPKGLPPRARARYLIRHGGPAWFVFWLAPYVREVPSSVHPSDSRAIEGSRQSRE